MPLLYVRSFSSELRFLKFNSATYSACCCRFRHFSIHQVVNGRLHIMLGGCGCILMVVVNSAYVAYNQISIFPVKQKNMGCSGSTVFPENCLVCIEQIRKGKTFFPGPHYHFRIAVLRHNGRIIRVNNNHGIAKGRKLLSRAIFRSS